MKYKVYVEEISYGFVSVEAENPEEASEKAEEKYFEGLVDWNGGDWRIRDCTPIDD